MFIVTGCPRSGTSLMMAVLRKALGQDRILGDELPLPLLKRSRGIKPNSDKSEEREKQLREDFINLNKSGYWECPHTRKGFEELPPEDHNRACKILPFALKKCNSSYFKKILVMARHPRVCEQSMANMMQILRRDDVDKKPNPNTNLSHVQLFRAAVVNISRCITENPDVPVMVVEYDKLIRTPDDTTKQISSFLGEDICSGACIVNPSFNRTKPAPGDDEGWERKEKLYRLLLNGEFSKIVSRLPSRGPFLQGEHNK